MTKYFSDVISRTGHEHKSLVTMTAGVVYKVRKRS